MLTPEVIEVSLSSFSSPGISLVSVWPGREERVGQGTKSEREMNLGYRLTPGIYPSDASLSLTLGVLASGIILFSSLVLWVTYAISNIG